MINELARFEDKYIIVPEAGCWLWLGGVTEDGYGGFTFNHKTILAHRASWMIFRGQIPDGICVLHRCDVCSCVNPNHLFLGSHADNMKDMKAKGRRKNVGEGSRNGRAILTRTQVDEIRYMRKLGIKLKTIADLYSVGISTVANITLGHTWKTFST